MRKRNIKTVRAYSKWYYEHKLKHKHPEKWTMSKSKWVKCPFCNSNHWYNPMRLYEPEVFAMNYGGRGCIEKYSESKMVADGLGSIVYGVKDNYMRDLKGVAVRFLRLYCSEDELKHLFSDLVATVTVAVPTDLSLYSGRSGSGGRSGLYGYSGLYRKCRIDKKPSMAVKPVMEGVKTTWEKKS